MRGNERESNLVNRVDITTGLQLDRAEIMKGLGSKGSLFVSWLLNVPATCQCISGTDLLRQLLRAATLR